MLIENIFSSFIASATIPVNQNLIDYAVDKIVYDQKARQDTINQSNFLDLSDPSIKEITDQVQRHFNDIHLKIGLAKTHSQIVSEAWFNIGNNLNIDSPHCHPGRVFSAVYYLATHDYCGDLIFINPNDSLVHTIHPTFVKSYNCFNSHNFKICPRTGLLVIFPSYLQHYVRLNSGGERISLAFNSQVTEKCL